MSYLIPIIKGGIIIISFVSAFTIYKLKNHLSDNELNGNKQLNCKNPVWIKDLPNYEDNIEFDEFNEFDEFDSGYGYYVDFI